MPEPKHMDSESTSSQDLIDESELFESLNRGRFLPRRASVCILHDHSSMKANSKSRASDLFKPKYLLVKLKATQDSLKENARLVSPIRKSLTRTSTKKVTDKLDVKLRSYKKRLNQEADAIQKIGIRRSTRVRKTIQRLGYD